MMNNAQAPPANTDGGDAASLPASQNESLPQSSAAGSAGPAVASATRTMTVTAVATTPDESQEVLRLTLRDRPAVRWEEGVVDNEGLGRKSSKRCCIFHKQRPFGESSTDSSDDEDGQGGDKKPRAIARPKKHNDDVPDFQRFHA